MRNPRLTIAYLDKLKEYGFTDDAFWRIHHFREKGEKHPIKTHKSYCEGTDTFLDDGNNERVQIRLEIILKYFEEYYRGDAGSGDAINTFIRLADAAYALVPRK